MVVESVMPPEARRASDTEDDGTRRELLVLHLLVLHRLLLRLRRSVRVNRLLLLLIVLPQDVLLAVQGLAQLLVTRMTTCPKR